MLRDIVVITQNAIKEIQENKKALENPRKVYDSYIKLTNVIKDVHLVSNHYLVHGMTESFLQNSSSGEPIDKWREVLNDDLKTLNNSIKEYLHSLQYFRFEDAPQGIITNFYSHRDYCYFVSNSYNIGFIGPYDNWLQMIKLNTKRGEKYSDSIVKGKKIDLTTLEQKKELQTTINERNEKLKLEALKLKEYIKSKYTLDDLL